MKTNEEYANTINIIKIDTKDERYPIIEDIVNCYGWIDSNRDSIKDARENGKLSMQQDKILFYAIALPGESVGYVNGVNISIGPAIVPTNGRQQDNFIFENGIKAGIAYRLNYQHPFEWVINRMKLPEKTAIEIGKYLFLVAGLPQDYITCRQLSLEVEIENREGIFNIVQKVTLISRKDNEDEPPIITVSQEMSQFELELIRDCLSSYIYTLDTILMQAALLNE